jgi:hypothetical protein
MHPRLPLGGALQIDLDDLRRTGADEEKKLDFGPTLEQARDNAIQLFGLEL